MFHGAAEMIPAPPSTNATRTERLSLVEAAEFLGYSQRQVKRFVQEGRLPAHGRRRCRKWFAREDLVAFELAQKVETAAPAVFSQAFAGEAKRQALIGFLRSLGVQFVGDQTH